MRIDALPSFYGDFRPVADGEVRALLLRAWRDWGLVEAPFETTFPGVS